MGQELSNPFTYFPRPFLKTDTFKIKQLPFDIHKESLRIEKTEQESIFTIHYRFRSNVISTITHYYNYELQIGDKFNSIKSRKQKNNEYVFEGSGSWVEFKGLEFFPKEDSNRIAILVELSDTLIIYEVVHRKIINIWMEDARKSYKLYQIWDIG